MHSFNNPARQRKEQESQNGRVETGSVFPFTVGVVGDLESTKKYQAFYLHAHLNTEFPLRDTYAEAEKDAIFARQALTEAVANAATRRAQEKQAA